MRKFARFALFALVTACGINPARSMGADLYVGQGDLATVNRYSDTGVLLANPFAAGGNDPEGMAFGPEGNLYVVSNFGHRFDVYDGTTGATIRTVTGAWGTLNDVAFDASGTMFVSDYGAGEVLKVDKVSGAILQSYTVPSATGITFAADGNLLADSYSTGNIYTIDTTSGAISNFGSVGSDAAGIAVGPDGRYYVARLGAGEVDVVGATGGAGSLFADIQGSNNLYPYFLTFTAGKMYVTISNPPGVVQIFDAASGAYLNEFATGDRNVTGIAVMPSEEGVTTPEPGNLAPILGLGFTSAICARRRRQRRSRVRLAAFAPS